jgi:hypothetical protein
MSLAAYDDLKNAIINQLHRDDLASVVDDWIDLCEADFNRRLRVSNMETSTTFTVDSEEESLPSGFLELRNIQLNTNPVKSLTFMSPQEMDRRYGGISGEPSYFCVIGNQFQFAPPPDGSYTCEVTYYAAFDAISASTTTNWVLTNHPDVYFYGALIHSAPYVMNDKRIALWEMLYEKALARIDQEDVRKKYMGSTLEMRTDIVGSDIRYG